MGRDPRSIQIVPAPRTAQSTTSHQLTTTDRLLSRTVVLQNGKLEKNGRWEFAPAIQTALNLAPLQHRAHTISYEIIAHGVADTINEALNQGVVQCLEPLRGLIAAVFPRGPAAAPHNLQALATEYHTRATTAVSNIIHLFQAKDRDMDKILDEANKLMDALNNSPQNLRPGDASTNSSIGGALDLTQDSTKGELPVDTRIVDVQGTPQEVLKQSRKVIRIIDLHEEQVKTLLTETYSKGGEIHLYSSGQTLQSSDNPSMTVGNMISKNQTPVAIQWKPGEFYLFDLPKPK